MRDGLQLNHKHTIFFIVAITAMGLLGVVGKFHLATSGQPSALSASEALELVSEHLDQEGIVPIGQIPLTKDKTYLAAGYTSPQCDGRLLVVPILRNAEIKGLRSLVKRPLIFVVRGAQFKAFPAGRVWLDRTLRRLPFLDHPLPPIAVAEDGHCALLSLLHS